MALRNIEYTSKSRLSCAGCAPSDVIICLNTDGLTTVPGQNFIYAELINHIRLSNQCGGYLYRYIFQYDDVILNPGVTLSCADIKGVVCEGCLTDWVREYIATVGAGSYPPVALCPPGYFVGR